jgi:hypothetical protein
MVFFEILVMLRLMKRLMKQLFLSQGIIPKRAAHVLELRQQCLDPFKEMKDLKNIGLGQRELMLEFAKTSM